MGKTKKLNVQFHPQMLNRHVGMKLNASMNEEVVENMASATEIRELEWLVPMPAFNSL